MPANQGFFRNDDLMLLFTSSLAGLGHERVTGALQSGLPGDTRTELIGNDDVTVQFLHRIASRNRFLRHASEFFQNTPGVEDAYTYLYVKQMRRDTKKVYERVIELALRKRPKPKVLLIVSTHFSLAHKIAEVKEKISTELGMCVLLCVVVTDDSPQKVWAVNGADFIFVPSRRTRDSLMSHMEKYASVVPKFVVSPYPVSLKLDEELSSEKWRGRLQQVDPSKKDKMKIIVPISGAAVQLSFFKDIISYLDTKSTASFVVVSRESSYTKDFLSWCERVQSVKVIADKIDRDVVLNYEKEVLDEVPSVELTKPSEQSFKALLTPKSRGGMVLLFSGPVGRQEYDNIAFLARHGLLPSSEDQLILQNLYRYGEKEEIDSDFLERASCWRGVMLPKKGKQAAKAIYYLKSTGILLAMMNFKKFPKHRELKGNGVQIFWRRLRKLVYSSCPQLTGL